ncbi:MAG: divergent polysaccharide deacetylase family protein [Alkalispirochaeta sp.]
MHGWRASIVLLILLVATVTGMVWLLRPAVFGAGGGQPRLDAAAIPEPHDQNTPDGTSPESSRERRQTEVDNSEAAAEPEGPRLYLVLDDAGHDLDHLREFVPFPGVFTVAVLPGLTYSREAAQMVIALGHEAILHQPMEAVGGNDPGPGAIVVSQSEREIRRILTSNLSTMPGVVGVNNHMGSLATGDARVMQEVAATLRRHRLFFLDSRTTHLSVAGETIRTAGVPTVERDVFLDNVREDEAISDQLDRGLAIAEEQGHAILIGHVTSPELAQVLIDRYAEISEAGYTFSPLSDLINREREPLNDANSGN